jgi:hypothetical protein
MIKTAPIGDVQQMKQYEYNVLRDCGSETSRLLEVRIKIKISPI